MFQTPNPAATGCPDPTGWITTGTPVPGSPDLKTQEQLAKLSQLVQAYNPGGSIATVGPQLANYLLLPDGTVSADLSLAQFEAQWAADRFAEELAAKIYLILYWGPRCPTQVVYATTDPAALAIHNVQVSSVDSSGSSTAPLADVQAAQDAATAQATTTQPAAPVGPTVITLASGAPLSATAPAQPAPTAGANLTEQQLLDGKLTESTKPGAPPQGGTLGTTAAAPASSTAGFLGLTGAQVGLALAGLVLVLALLGRKRGAS